MKKYISFLLSTVIGLASYSVSSVLLAQTGSQSPSLKQLKLAYAETGGTVRVYDGVRLRYYPNHVIVADSYDEDVIRSIAALARELGWDIVYVQVPEEYREYANVYFSDEGLRVNYFSIDLNPDDSLNLFYGAPGYSGRNGHYWDNRHHRDYRDGGRHHRDGDRNHRDGDRNHRGGDRNYRDGDRNHRQGVQSRDYDVDNRVNEQQTIIQDKPARVEMPSREIKDRPRRVEQPTTEIKDRSQHIEQPRTGIIKDRPQHMDHPRTMNNNRGSQMNEHRSRGSDSRKDGTDRR